MNRSLRLVRVKKTTVLIRFEFSIAFPGRETVSLVKIDAIDSRRPWRPESHVPKAARRAFIHSNDQFSK